MVLHVLARDELSFPFQRLTLFEGLEGYADQLANPSALRDAYLAELEAYLAEVRKTCRDHRIDYVLLDTGEKLDVPLSAFLAARAASHKT